MRRQDFSFELPERLIAHYPSAERVDCRLLQLDGRDGAMVHGQFSDLLDLLQPNDLLVFNNTKVVPARLYGRKPTGGRVEVLLERMLPSGQLLAQIGSNKKLHPGAQINIFSRESSPAAQGQEPDGTGEGGDSAEIVATLSVIGRENAFYQLQLEAGMALDELFELAGHMPLPPYIKRDDKAVDFERYQTVYAENTGAVAAPTAGLHFDQPLIDALQAKGVNSTFVTLHVGAATFQPIRVDDITEHKMHSEYIQVSEDNCDRIKAAWASGGRVIAVGSTSVRALETAAQSGALQKLDGDSNLFIYPGFEFQCVDAMITNFHLSESSLLMMVSAFAGKDYVLDAYKSAVENEYQFFSYGDAMFIEASNKPKLQQQFGNTTP